MPGNLEHSQHSYRTVGVEASDLHSWMDRPSNELGYDHRFLRHDPTDPPDWAVRKYTMDTARLVMEDHVKLDDHDFLEEWKRLLNRELVTEVRECIRRKVEASVRGVGNGYVVLYCKGRGFAEGSSIGIVEGERIAQLGYLVTCDRFLTVSTRENLQLKAGDVLEICEDNSVTTKLQMNLIDRVRGGQMNIDEAPALMKAFGRSAMQRGGRGKPSSVLAMGGKYQLDGSQVEVLESVLGLPEGEVLTVVGPPGSGKTEVIAKAAYELSQRGERVLICSHTNRAVDNAVVKLPPEIALRLGRPEKMLRALIPYTLGEKAQEALGGELERINQRIEDIKVILGTLQSYSDEGGTRMLRDELFTLLRERGAMISRERVNQLKKARVVGATIAYLSNWILQPERFDLVMIDESSQVPLFLALLGMLKARKWVLIGDHNQLLPIFKTVKDKTLLRRLSSFCYFKERFRDYSKWLTWHYRSNPGIIDFPNRHVYAGRILVHPSCGGVKLSLMGEGYPEYLIPEKPSVFIDVAGVESHEGGSRFNSLEIEVVKKILTDLLVAGVPGGSIGVIAPYRAQVKSLREQLPRKGIEVNTVDSYQGREKEVIVFSATSTRDMGFVEDVNRLNVALTRARRKLIVVGNLVSLSHRGGLLRRFVEEASLRNCLYCYASGNVSRVEESILV